MNAVRASGLVRSVPPWIDLHALEQVLAYAAAETLFWEAWQGPRRADEAECTPLPAAQQEAATWARDEVLLGDELGRGHDEGRVYCWLTGRGRDYLTALRHEGAS
ncbi:hypothetical protein [Actinokineospora sp. UTMC 2448]|uniref:hypothetical protein n=1 Tax=Actinokineospora sp. UTMC 2448 TaxID=2268449 RepID=UPI002164644B|nr:hypothetical protein [Actinokineospora sp. UTMC 2448]UVS78372.1 hypothetical protein Actkin_02105 [Actinokineospora sp. UTMC 2448]